MSSPIRTANASTATPTLQYPAFTPCAQSQMSTVQYHPLCTRPTLSDFILAYDDGRTQLLLCVHGLLSISYRNASYNIPIAIWLTREYPRQPPIAYVVPTNDMLVKAGRYVDVSGKCSIDYLQNWARKSEVGLADKSTGLCLTICLGM